MQEVSTSDTHSCWHTHSFHHPFHLVGTVERPTSLVECTSISIASIYQYHSENNVSLRHTETINNNEGRFGIQSGVTNGMRNVWMPTMLQIIGRVSSDSEGRSRTRYPSQPPLRGETYRRGEGIAGQ